MDKYLRYIKRLPRIFLGNIICALGINIFYTPNKLIASGLTGISLIFQYLINVPSGIILFILNIPILLVGAKRIDIEFVINTILSTFMFSLVLTLTKDISNVIKVNDILIASLLGGGLTGLGGGIVLKNRASQGGIDIIATILKKEKNMDIGKSSILMNSIIISISSILFGVIPAGYTIISTVVAGLTLDKVLIGLDTKKKVIIISEKENYMNLGDRVIEKFGRGITYIDVVGGYSKDEKVMIYIILSSREISKLKDLVNELSPESMVIVENVVEVIGSSFG